MTIWLIGGTSESKQLAIALYCQQIPFIVTVTTETARNLYADALTTVPPNMQQVRVGKLSSAELAEFISEHQVTTILDASHPFAVEVSCMAIAAAKQYQLPYLRFERPDLTENNDLDGDWVQTIPSFASLFEPTNAEKYLIEQTVLLTIGYQPLHLFSPWCDRARLYARVLPSVTAIEAAKQAGFTAERLIAIRPPIAADLEKALWQQWQITVVVTKASGSAGGEDIKRAIAAELQIPLVIVSRAKLDYPSQTDDIDVAIAFCR